MLILYLLTLNASTFSFSAYEENLFIELSAMVSREISNCAFPSAY